MAQENEDPREILNRSRALVRAHKESEESEELLEKLPQGHGSGLDADTLDGMHAAEILAKAPGRGGGGGGSGSGSGDATSIQGKAVDITERVDDTILVFKSGSDTYIHETKGAPGAHASTHENGGGDEVSVAGLSGELADPQPPKSHTHPCSQITDHDKTLHDGLNIDADTVDGLHGDELATDAELSTHAGVENAHHTKFTTVEHDTTLRHSLGTVVPHDNLADLAEKSHVSLTDKGTNTHPQIDTHLAAAAPHSGHEQTAKKDQANGYAGLSGSSKLSASQMPTGKVTTTLSFAVTGTLAVGTDKAPTLLAPCSLTITKVKLVVKTAPTGADLIVDVNKNGTTIFTTQANRPKIVAGSTTGDSGTPDIISLAEGDKLTIDIDQVGSTIAGADLTVETVCDQTVTFT